MAPAARYARWVERRTEVGGTADRSGWNGGPKWVERRTEVGVERRTEVGGTTDQKGGTADQQVGSSRGHPPWLRLFNPQNAFVR